MCQHTKSAKSDMIVAAKELQKAARAATSENSQKTKDHFSRARGRLASANSAATRGQNGGYLNFLASCIATVNSIDPDRKDLPSIAPSLQNAGANINEFVGVGRR